MLYKIDKEKVEVIVDRKNNTNTYIRITDDLKIKVSTSYLMTDKKVKKLLDENIEQVKEMLSKKAKQKEKEEQFFLFGKKYDIIIVPTLDNIEFSEDKIYVKDTKTLNKWLTKYILKVYQSRLKINYDLFNEEIPYPTLKIRDMKTRWGVCNKKNKTVTLNKRLINYDIDKLDYVIIHELCHFVYFDHSRNFWSLVNKYCNDYKKIKKELKE
ncbi:MAG: YgjP-like metallopeptidase domain-containing protein [Mycoplasmatota bacterium]